jgi:polyhydroxyalkanoate synthesis repressor PhaR
MEHATVVVRKYGNRRLYDTTNSRYVNLDEIAALIRQGRDVQVIDAQSGRDLTRVTLTQIITEDAKDKPTGLPLELLRQLILASDQVRQEFLMWYLKSAFETYQQVQDTVQNRLSQAGSAILSPVETVKKLLSTPQSQIDSEVVALRQRVAELEARLENTPRKRPARKKH